MKSLKSSSREIAVVLVVLLVPEVAARVSSLFSCAAFRSADDTKMESSSDVDSKSLSKVSPLCLFRSPPFDFRLKGLENFDKHFDEELVDEMVEALELPPLLEQASL